MAQDEHRRFQVKLAPVLAALEWFHRPLDEFMRQRQRHQPAPEQGPDSGLGEPSVLPRPLGALSAWGTCSNLTLLAGILSTLLLCVAVILNIVTYCHEN